MTHQEFNPMKPAAEAPPDSVAEIKGFFVASAVATLPEFRALGESVLMAHGITSLDPQAYYPATLRRLVHSAIYDRFGTAAIFWLGIESWKFAAATGSFKLGDAASESSADEAQSAFNELPVFLAMAPFTGAVRDAVDGPALRAAMAEFLSNFTELIRASSKSSTRGNSYEPGWTIESFDDDGYFELALTSASLVAHEAFGRGIYHSHLRLLLPDNVNFSLVQVPDRSFDFPEYSVCRHRLEYSLMPAGQTHQQLAAQERWQARDQVFKRALSLAFEQEAIAAKALRELTQTLKELTQSHRYTMESIRYASLLQRNQLPKPVQWQHKLRDLAIDWQPKDIIGGDIWWMSGAASDGPISIALIDCTGHGVPGAMTAMLVSNALERQCLAALGSTPQDYFAAIQQTLSQSFGAADQVGAIDNGCDLLLLQIDRERQTLTLGLGGIGLLVYRRKSQSVHWVESPRSGISAKLESLARTSGCELRYDAGDRLLLVTDGVTDQIGGPQNPRAYGYRGVQQVFSNTVDASASEAVQALAQSLRQWQGSQIRRDDVTILCIDL